MANSPVWGPSVSPSPARVLVLTSYLDHLYDKRRKGNHQAQDQAQIGHRHIEAFLQTAELPPLPL